MESEDALERLRWYIRSKETLLHRQISNTDEDEIPNLAAEFWRNNRNNIQNEFSPEERKAFDEFAKDILGKDAAYEPPPKGQIRQGEPGQNFMDQIRNIGTKPQTPQKPQKPDLPKEAIKEFQDHISQKPKKPDLPKGAIKEFQNHIFKKPDDQFLKAAQALLDYKLPATHDPNYKKYVSEYRANLKATLDEAMKYEDLTALYSQTGHGNANTWRGMAESLHHNEAISKLPLEPTEAQKMNFEKVRKEEVQGLDSLTERLSLALKDREPNIPQESEANKDDIALFNAGHTATMMMEQGGEALYNRYAELVKENKKQPLAMGELHSQIDLFAKQLAGVSEVLREKIQQNANRAVELGIDHPSMKFSDDLNEQIHLFDAMENEVAKLEEKTNLIKQDVSPEILPAGAAADPLSAPERNRQRTVPPRPLGPAPKRPHHKRRKRIDPPNTEKVKKDAREIMANIATTATVAPNKKPSKEKGMGKSIPN